MSQRTDPTVLRVELARLLADYWDLAYDEGRRGASHDTPNGDAQLVLTTIGEITEAMMRIIDLPEWNDLPETIRMALAIEGEFYEPDYGADIALAVYNKLRTLLDGLNLDRPDPAEPRLDLPDP